VAGPAAGPHAEARFVRPPLATLARTHLRGTAPSNTGLAEVPTADGQVTDTLEDERMSSITQTAMIVLALVTIGCRNSTDATQTTPPPASLPAPVGLSASVVTCDPYSCGLTFSFNAVEYADSYLIYYSASDDTSTARSLAAGQFSPIGWSYSRANAYGNATYYFWVRAYDGQHYGHWSTSVTAILY